MSKISLVASIGYLCSILAINFIFKHLDFKKFYLSTAFIINILNLASLIIVLKKNETLSLSATFFCYLFNSLLVFTHELNFLPLLAACSRLCPEDLEGTTYGIFTSMFNFGYYLATVAASVLLKICQVTTKNYSNLWMVIVIQVVYGMTVLAWLFCLQFPDPENIMRDRRIKKNLVIVDQEPDEDQKKLI